MYTQLGIHSFAFRPLSQESSERASFIDLNDGPPTHTKRLAQLVSKLREQRWIGMRRYIDVFEVILCLPEWGATDILSVVVEFVTVDLIPNWRERRAIPPHPLRVPVFIGTCSHEAL